MSFLKKNWLRTIMIIALFTSAGTVPFIIEQQMLPLVQLSSMVTDFYNPLTGEFNLDELLNNLQSINVVASTPTQTTLAITIVMQNKPYNFYPMKIPAANLDLYFRAGRPYDREKQIIQQFKADPNFNGVGEPAYDFQSVSWVRTVNIIIPQEVSIPVGGASIVTLLVTLYTNGQEENALSQMLGTMIRGQKIPAQRLYAKGEIFFMGVPIPVSIEVPEFALPVSAETGEMSTLLSSFFVDLKPETSALDFFHLADMRNYWDENQNYYRDWNDSAVPNGLKDESENFTEPILENGTISASVLLRLTPKLSVGGGSISIANSPWNLQEGQNETTGLLNYGDLSQWNTESTLWGPKYTPKPEIENTIWGTADQQILLYCPTSLATKMGQPHWSNRIIGTIGFLNNESISLDGHGGSVPLLVTADVKITGDARPNSNFSSGEAINSFIPQIMNYNNVSIGIIGNIKLKLGQMPLSLVLKMELGQDLGGLLGGSSVQTQGLSSLQTGGTGVSDMIPFIMNFFSLKNFIFNGLAMDIYHKILQANTSLDLDLFFPYGIYLPETEEEALNFLDLAGGPIQIFNESKPSNWNTLNTTFPYNIPDTILGEDFESYANDSMWHSSPIWTIYDPTTGSNITLTPTAGASNSKGIIYTTDGTLNASISRNFNPSDGITGFYFDILMNNTDGKFYAILHNNSLQLLQLEFQNTTGGNNLLFGSKQAYLNNTNWYRVFVTLNRGAGTYDVSVSGIVNETFAPTGSQINYQIKNTITPSDFIQVVDFNEMNINDTYQGTGTTGSFTTSRIIRQLYYILNNETFSPSGTTNQFVITNYANSSNSDPLIQVRAVNKTNSSDIINFAFTSGVPSAGYEYTFDSSARKVRTFLNGPGYNVSNAYNLYITHFVEEDVITAPVNGTTVTFTDANPSTNTQITISYHARDRDVYSYSAAPSIGSGYQYTWNQVTQFVTTYYNGLLYQIPAVYQLTIDYNLGTIGSGNALINNIDPTNLTLSLNNSRGPVTLDNINFRNEKTLQEAQNKWYNDHLIFNITIESGSLKDLFSKILTKIGAYRNGMGIAYHFNSKHLIQAYGTSAVGYYSKVLDNLMDTSTYYPIGTMPTGNDTIDMNTRGLPTGKVPFSITIDDIILNVRELFPQYGLGLNSLTEQLGIDPLLIEYLNKSLDDWGKRTGKGSGANGTGTLMDFLQFDITNLLSFMYQDGPKNDLFDYMIDKGYLNDTYNALNLTALVSGILNLVGFDDMMSGVSNGGGGDGTSIYAMIPELLQATNINFDDLILDLIDYLRVNMSYEQGIKPFELLDLLFTSTGTETTDLVSGIDEDSWYLIFEDLKSLLSNIDLMDLAKVAINNPLPFSDYLNRSDIITESVILPLISSIFGAGGEAEEFDWDKIFRNVDDLVRGLLFGVEIPDGVPESWENKPVNLLALLQSAESLLSYNPLTNETISSEDALTYLSNLYNFGTGLEVFTSSEQEFIADVPPYDNLRLMSAIVLSLMQSGFTAEDLYQLLADLGILDLTELSGGGSGDPEDMTAGITALIPLLGSFCPPGEWLSLLRSMGIWSTWEGYFEMMAHIDISIWFINFGFDWNIANFLGDYLINLEKLLATGIMELLPNFGMFDIGLPFDFQLSLNENQSYGNPWYYQMGYDTSSNLGPYHQYLSQSSSDCDNWGWVPLGWDPGGNPVTNPGNPWGDPAKNYTSDKGKAYKKDFISLLVSNIPLAIDLDLPTIELNDLVFDLIPGMVQITFDMLFPLDIAVRLRMEGNPSALVNLFEDTGISLVGFITHLYPNANQWIYDAFGTLAGGGTTGNGSTEEIIDLNDLDLTLFVDSFLSSGVNIYHYLQYLLDPEFLSTAKWFLDSGYMIWDINTSNGMIENPLPYTLYWDYNWGTDPLNVLPGAGGEDITHVPYFGDGDSIPDEYPWYRFTLPALNQINPNRGPGTYQQADVFRYPAMIDSLTPIGYPGQGYYLQAPDDIPDGLQHYWFDTPYAFVNVTPNASDPWPNINPLLWNNVPGPGYYTWTIAGDPNSPYYWGESAPAHPRRPGFPYEQVPLINLPDSLWDTYYAPLYYGWASNPTYGIFSGGSNYFGSAPVDSSISDINFAYPDIWASFAYTLDQSDYRFGYWEKDSTDESVDGTAYDYLNCLPFWTLMSTGVSPHISGAIDVFDIPSMMTDITAAVSSNLGSDYWHSQQYNSTYRWFEPKYKYWDNMGFDYDSNTTENSNNSNLYWRGMRVMPGATTVFDEFQNLIWTDYGNGTLRVWNPLEYYGDLYNVDLNPFGMLEWIWEGAGDILKVRNNSGTFESYYGKYLAPYSVPYLEDTITWLAGKGLSMNNILDMLPQIIDEFSGTGSTDMVSNLISTNNILSIIKSMENYFTRVPATLNMTDWAQYHDHDRSSAYLDVTQNKTKASELILGMIAALPEVMDINPTKAARGLLSYLMPRLGDIFGTGGVGAVSGTTEMLDGLNDMLHESGLVDIIFQDTSKIRNLAFNLSIQNTILNITFGGWKFINVELDNLDIPINVTELGSAMGGDSENTGGLPISLPIDFAKPLPYIELSTFNGPYDVLFQTLFANNNSPVANAEISFGEVQYWQDPSDPDNYGYYFNCTVYNSARIGWFNDSGLPDTPPNAKLFITNGTYAITHTNSTGYLNISGNIVSDQFGWVDPYLYIHCQPIDVDVFYYWWNVTTNSTQLTLKGNREIAAAPWIYAQDGEVSDMVVQTSTPFNANVTNIDNDQWYEIFARVEIDDEKMDATQKIFFMANGTIRTINVSHGTSYDIRLWDSFQVQDKVWDVEGEGGNTKYTFLETATPDGSNIIYPTGPKVITGIRVNSGNWLDDTLTKAQIYYYDLEDTTGITPIYLLNWDIRTANATWLLQNFTGVNRTSLLYAYQTNLWTQDETPGGWEWSLTGSIDRGGGLKDWATDWVIFGLNETTYNSQQYAQTYRIIDFDTFMANFSQKTLTDFEIWYNYYEVPQGSGYGSKKWILAYSYDGKQIYPGTTFTVDRERRSGNPLILGYDNLWRSSTNPAIGYDLIWNAGDTYFNGTSSTARYHHNDTGAKYATFTYDVPIPSNQFVSQIDWSIVNMDDPSTNGIKMNVSAWYAGDSNGQNAGWKIIQNSTYGASVPAGGIFTRSVTSMMNVSGTFDDTFAKQHWLYLTSRGRDASENFTTLRFEILLQDNITVGNFANLGWNDTSPDDLNQYNTPENVSIRIDVTMYSFLNDWGITTVELPQGVVSGFHIKARMWDPQGSQASIGNPALRVFYPNVTFSYKTVLMENGSRLIPPLNTNLTALTSRVFMRFEMEDSIINKDVTGGRGDALYVDGNRTYGVIWTPLLTANMPRVITNTSIITIESNYLIDVGIEKNNAFRNYYMNLTLNNSRSYIELTRLITLSNNTEVSNALGIFPPKSVIDLQNGYPHTYQLGKKIDIYPTNSGTAIEYQLTFRASARFLKDFWVNGTSVVEFLWFSGIWDKPRGTFEVSDDRYMRPTTEGPIGRQAFRIVRIQ